MSESKPLVAGLWALLCTILFLAGTSLAIAANYVVVDDPPGGQITIRTGPGLGHDISGYLEPGEQLDVARCIPSDDNGQSHKPWCEVDYGDGQHGWTSSCCIAPSTDYTSGPPLITLNQDGGLRFRCDPSFKSCNLMRPVANKEEIVFYKPDSSNFITITDEVHPDNGDGWTSKYLCGTSWSHNEDDQSSMLCKYSYSNKGLLTVLVSQTVKPENYPEDWVIFVDTRTYGCEYFTRYVYNAVPTENHYNVSCAKAIPVTP